MRVINVGTFKQGLILFTVLTFVLLQQVDSHDGKIFEFEQPIDHFSFRTNKTYMQRYMISKTHWNESGPIFFYTGNEDSIEFFANITGFMWEIAPEFEAMVVFSEHRFYGKSFPVPKKENKLGLLTSEQALADHARLAMHLKNTIPGAKNSPVIAFGGSYGGLLAAWIRIKYPHIIDGSLACAAPIRKFVGMADCHEWFVYTTNAFRWGGKACPAVFKRAFDIIMEKRTKEGLEDLTKTFKLCKPLVYPFELYSWIAYTLPLIAMGNYPEAGSLFGPLPAWPVRKMCNFLKNTSATDDEIMKGVFSAMSVYFNHSDSQPKCIDLKFSPAADLLNGNWNYQICTEMVWPTCSGGPNDMFFKVPWNLPTYMKYCEKKTGVKPRPYMAKLMYGGGELQAASNILFSNGDLDPASGGGIHKDINPTVIALNIAEGAHHTDLRASTPNDPPSVIRARNTEKEWIRIWIEEARRARQYP